MSSAGARDREERECSDCFKIVGFPHSAKGLISAASVNAQRDQFLSFSDSACWRKSRRNPDFAINNLHDLHKDRTRQLGRQVIDKHAHRRQKALPIGNESGERGIASKPSGQHPSQCARLDVFAADIAG